MFTCTTTFPDLFVEKENMTWESCTSKDVSWYYWQLMGTFDACAG